MRGHRFITGHAHIRQTHSVNLMVMDFGRDRRTWSNKVSMQQETCTCNDSLTVRLRSLHRALEFGWSK